MYGFSVNLHRDVLEECLNVVLQPCRDGSENERKEVCFSQQDRKGDPFQPYYRGTTCTCSLINYQGFTVHHVFGCSTDGRPCTVYCYEVARRRVRRQKMRLVNGSLCYPDTDSNDRCFAGHCEVIFRVYSSKVSDVLLLAFRVSWSA